MSQKITYHCDRCGAETDVKFGAQVAWAPPGSGQNRAPRDLCQHCWEKFMHWFSPTKEVT